MRASSFLRITISIVAIAAVVGILVVGVRVDRIARIGAGYKAKILCSETFVAKRDSARIAAIEFENIDPTMAKIGTSLDETRKTVRASAFGLGRAQAVYRDGYGCTLANAGRIAPLPALPPMAASDPWPEAPPVSGRALAWIDYAAVDYALSRAMDDATAGHRALIVVVDGKVIDERYAVGFDQDTPMLGWSMSKSILATLIGAAQHNGLLKVTEPAPVSDWSDGDIRTRITWNNLLQMQSGLRFDEDYENPISDVNRMLFERADTGKFAAEKPSYVRFGSLWSYSSGTTNLLSRTLRETLEANAQTIHGFARDALFDPVGATSFVMEPDASGTPIGSSFMYATPRDWARIGQLYLQDGVWNGKRILPEGWVRYATEPAAASDNQYGAHLWLNGDGAAERERFFTGLPEDAYFMAGHDGQYTIIIPSKDLVIVRMGITRNADPINVVRPVVEDIYQAVGMAPSDAS